MEDFDVAAGQFVHQINVPAQGGEALARGVVTVEVDHVESGLDRETRGFGVVELVAVTAAGNSTQFDIAEAVVLQLAVREQKLPLIEEAVITAVGAPAVVGLLLVYTGRVDFADRKSVV